MAKEKLGVLCSGRGTDLQSIIDAIEAGQVPAEIAIVLTDKEAYALERARKAGIEAGLAAGAASMMGLIPYEIDAMKKVVRNKIELFGSAGRC